MKAEYILTGDAAKQEGRWRLRTDAIVSTDRPNARTEPSTDAPIWTQISNNERYDVISQQDGWVEIALDTTSAYVATDFVDVRYAFAGGDPIYPIKRKESLRTRVVNYALPVCRKTVMSGAVMTRIRVWTVLVLQSMYTAMWRACPCRGVSWEQARTGTKIDSSKMRPGDLIFYTNRKGTVNHVAMYIGNGQIVHAARAGEAASRFLPGITGIRTGLSICWETDRERIRWKSKRQKIIKNACRSTSETKWLKIRCTGS